MMNNNVKNYSNNNDDDTNGSDDNHNDKNAKYDLDRSLWTAVKRLYF